MILQTESLAHELVGLVAADTVSSASRIMPRPKRGSLHLGKFTFYETVVYPTQPSELTGPPVEEPQRSEWFNSLMQSVRINRPTPHRIYQRTTEVILFPNLPYPNLAWLYAQYFESYWRGAITRDNLIRDQRDVLSKTILERLTRSTFPSPYLIQMLQQYQAKNLPPS